MSLPEISVPDELTYVGVFLTLRCNYQCAYCINRHGGFSRRRELTTKQWIEGLNRLRIPRSLMVPLTLQGGEPSLHAGWPDIINLVQSEFYIDILTNLTFDLNKFIKNVLPERLTRSVPYASIRASYHPEADYDVLLRRVRALQGVGYDIGLFMVDHPAIDIEPYKRKALLAGIDFRTKQFLGYHGGVLYGTYRYPRVMCGEVKNVECKNTEILIAPDGHMHKCHRDLYAGINPIGHILDKDINLSFKYRKCATPSCNECDTKRKNNRFQQYGACSITLRST